MAPRAPVRNQEPIPTYRIDLSLPPEQRYIQLATDFAPKMRAITPLFDEVLATIIPWARLRRWIEFLASILLRRVYSTEETRELKSISRASGVDLYIIIAFNVLLDSLMGCTSGGVMTALDKKGGERTEGKQEERMLHFRTQDWIMDPLRSVLVVLEFARSKSEESEKVVARTVTYAGFVGVLTGVRDDLSISLNHRPTRRCSAFKLRLHQLLVIFSFRPAIASHLRAAILPDKVDQPPKLLTNLMVTMAQPHTTPCYIILCDGTMAIVLEKDLTGAKVRTSKEFIVHTNHDTSSTDSPNDAKSQEKTHKSSFPELEELIEESEVRRACVQKKWDSLRKRHEKKITGAVEKGEAVELKGPLLKEHRLREWVRAYPTMNECTHFGCILDPKTGTIRFLERGVEEEE